MVYIYSLLNKTREINFDTIANINSGLTKSVLHTLNNLFYIIHTADVFHGKGKGFDLGGAHGTELLAHVGDTTGCTALTVITSI